MSELIKGWSDEDLSYKIDSEGFDYFFRFYMDASDAVDPEFRELWAGYVLAADRLTGFLEERGVSL